MKFQVLIGSAVAALALGSCSSQPPGLISLNSQESGSDLRSIHCSLLLIGEEEDVSFPISEDPKARLSPPPPECFFPKFIQGVDVIVEAPENNDRGWFQDSYTVRVRGAVTCPLQVADPVVSLEGQLISITLDTEPPPELAFCPAIYPPATSPYEVTIPLGVLNSGNYTLQVNQERGEFRVSPLLDQPGDVINVIPELQAPAPSELANVSGLDLLRTTSDPATYSLLVTADVRCGTVLLEPQVRQRRRQINAILAIGQDPNLPLLLCPAPPADIFKTTTQIPLGELSPGRYQARVNGTTLIFWVQ